MGNDADGQMVKFGSRRSLDKCGLLTVRRGKMKSHIKAVHRDGGFDMKIWIKLELKFVAVRIHKGDMAVIILWRLLYFNMYKPFK